MNTQLFFIIQKNNSTIEKVKYICYQTIPANISKKNPEVTNIDEPFT